MFVPGSRPERFDKALAARAGAVTIGLEDAVAPAGKHYARAAVAAWLQPRHAVVLRINSAYSPWLDADLALCGRPRVAAVMCPKAEHVDTLAPVAQAGAQALLPLVESAAGIAALDARAATPGVQRLAFGSIDLQADLVCCARQSLSMAR